MVSDSARSRSIAVFLLITSIYWASIYVYMPVLAVHAENLGASMGLVGAIVGAYGFSQLVLRVPLGIWSDRIGARKPFIVAGLVAAGIAALGLGLSSDPAWLVVWRAVSGVAAAAWVTFTVLFASYFAAGKATRAMAYVSFVGGLSEMLSSYAGGIIAQTWGWRAPFYVGVVLALLGASAAAVLLREQPVTVRRNVTPMEILRIGTVPLLLVVSIVAMLTSWTQWVTGYGFTPIYAARLGADRADLGTLTASYQMAGTIATLASAYLSEWIGLRATVTLGIAIMSAGAFMVPMVGTLWLVGVTQVLGGVGRGLSRPVLMGLSIRSVAVGDRATAMGVFQAVYALGMFAGPASTGFLGDAFGLSSVFVVAGVVSLAGVILVMTKVPTK